jgi:integrase
MEKKFIEIKRGSVRIKIYQYRRVKKGKEYSSFAVVDHSQSERRLLTFSDLGAAKAKAAEIAEATAKGKTEILQWEDGLRVEIRKSLEAIEPTGLTLLPASQLFAQAVQVLGTPYQLLQACQYWKTNRPNKPFNPKPVKNGVEDYMRHRKELISHARFRTETSYLNWLKTRFSDKCLHEIDTAALDQGLGSKDWKATTRNDVLSTISLLYGHAAVYNWVPPGFNPIKNVKRLKAIPGPIEIFTPEEAEQILAGLCAKDPELVPFMAVWCFAGLRKEEIGRLTWENVNQAIQTGWIELHAKQTKTGRYRTVPMKENLRAWLCAYRKDSGSVLPVYWRSPTKACENRLKEICRHISRKTGVKWKQNAPRHSFGTYYFKICKDPGETVAAMGTSLEKFQSNYWNKSRTVTEEMAEKWFNVLPEEQTTV